MAQRGRRLTTVTPAQALLQHYMPEMEEIKGMHSLHSPRQEQNGQKQDHSPDTVRITTSNLPQLHNWGLNMPAAHGFPSQPQLQPSDWDLLSGQPAAAGTAGALSSTPSAPYLQGFSNGNGYAQGGYAQIQAGVGLQAPGLSLPLASQALRDKHALMPAAPRRVYTPSTTPVTGGPVSYPTMAPPTPLQPLHAENAALAMAQASPSLLDVDFPAHRQPPALPQSQPQLPPQGFQAPSPHLELQLGPQEVQVASLPAPSAPPDPGATCSHGPADQLALPAPVEPLGVDAPGDVAVVKEGAREVQISVALMDEFLRYAASNTQRNTESCGILSGRLDERRGVFEINTLIIPKQKGTSDTVEMLGEEEVWEAQDSASLYPLGWIHTHPSQTCFLSSIDVHTQCGYQTMLEEAIAIVMAPRDASKKCGIFRLSTPGGLKLVQKCTERGFHAHPPTATRQPVYELCGHVYLNPRVGFEVKDLR